MSTVPVVLLGRDAYPDAGIAIGHPATGQPPAHAGTPSKTAAETIGPPA